MRKIVFNYLTSMMVQPIDWDNHEIDEEDIEINFYSLKEIYDTMRGLLEFIGIADIKRLFELADEIDKGKSETIERLRLEIAELKGQPSQVEEQE